MKTVRISDESHKKLVKVAGHLQAASGKGKSLEAAIAKLTMLDGIITEYETGMELNRLVWDQTVPKEQAFLWFWALASLTKCLQDSYGFDSLIKYALLPAAKHFSDCLDASRSSELDEALFRYFEKHDKTPALVKRFLRKCGNDGFGHYVRSGEFSLSDLYWYLQYIICYENGQWNDKYIDNIDKARNRSQSIHTLDD
ncbi:MAG: hypothetical protein WCC94_08470 [Candidatus Bathyarchaeia archaeon]